jgi:hypothetical protein
MSIHLRRPGKASPQHLRSRPDRVCDHRGIPSPTLRFDRKRTSSLRSTRRLARVEAEAGRGLTSAPFVSEAGDDVIPSASRGPSELRCRHLSGDEIRSLRLEKGWRWV